jgi:hypothetical protein
MNKSGRAAAYMCMRCRNPGGRGKVTVLRVGPVGGRGKPQTMVRGARCERHSPHANGTCATVTLHAG